MRAHMSASSPGWARTGSSSQLAGGTHGLPEIFGDMAQRDDRLLPVGWDGSSALGPGVFSTEPFRSGRPSAGASVRPAEVDAALSLGSWVLVVGPATRTHDSRVRGRAGVVIWPGPDWPRRSSSAPT